MSVGEKTERIEGADSPRIQIGPFVSSGRAVVNVHPEAFPDGASGQVKALCIP